MSKKPRSSPYPSISVHTAYKYLVSIYGEKVTATFTRNSLAKILDKKESTIYQIAASLCYYGWIERLGGSYYVTEDGEFAALQVDNLLPPFRKAFSRCQLFQLLYKNSILKEAGPLSEEMRDVLREGGVVTDTAMDKAWKSFLDSSISCELINEYGQFKADAWPYAKRGGPFLSEEKRLTDIKNLTSPNRVSMQLKLDGGVGLISLPHIISPGDIDTFFQAVDTIRDQLRVYLENGDEATVVRIEEYREGLLSKTREASLPTSSSF